MKCGEPETGERKRKMAVSKNVKVSPKTAKIKIEGFAPIVLIQTPYQRRAQEIIKTFTKELHSVQKSHLAIFLYHYFTCEALARLLLGARVGITPQKALEGKNKLRLNSLEAALRRSNVSFDKTAAKRIFEANRHSFAQASARKLRDRIVHGMNHRAIEEVYRRGASLVDEMRRFIRLIDEAAGESHRF